MSWWRFGSGEAVVSRKNSKMAFKIFDFLEEALLRVDSSTSKFLEAQKDYNFFKMQIDLPRVVGRSNTVVTTDTDYGDIVYVPRKGNRNASRFMLDAEGEETNLITVVFLKNEKPYTHIKQILPDDPLFKNGDFYVLLDAYFGEMTEPNPWDPNIIKNMDAVDRAQDFWYYHAYVWGEMPCDCVKCQKELILTQTIRVGDTMLCSDCGLDYIDNEIKNRMIGGWGLLKIP